MEGKKNGWTMIREEFVSCLFFPLEATTPPVTLLLGNFGELNMSERLPAH